MVARKKKYNINNANDRRKVKDMSVKLQLLTEALTRKDLRTWRQAWQMAINVDYPNRVPLLNVYTDVNVDMHVTGCVEQRNGFTLNKSFKLVNIKTGEENPQITELFEVPWFKTFMTECLNARYWGCTLVELGDIIEVNGKPAYNGIKVVPRTHVIPEYGVIVPNENSTWQCGYDYRNSEMSRWCIEIGDPYDLGLFLKCAQHTIPKKNMASFWDMFGEIFGMPIRIANTTSRDKAELDKIERLLADMGAAAYGLFPEGTTIDIKESNRTDCFNVYDKRIDRCNNELSKGLLTVTMTMEDGSSLSQSQVHQDMLQNLVSKDADFLRDIINWKLIPKMISHGFPVSGYRFDWDESIDYTPEQQRQVEDMLLRYYDVDPKYWIEKYNIPIIEKKQDSSAQLVKPLSDNSFFD